MADKAFHFDGFYLPAYTVVPDNFFDVLAPHLTEAELRCCLYIIRRTFGFKKSADDISIQQLTKGITKRTGDEMDSGTGMAKSSVVRGLRGLEAKGVIESVRNESEERGHQPTTYRLRFKDGTTLVAQRDKGGSAKLQGGTRAKRQALVAQSDTQETEIQETVQQEPPDPPRAGGQHRTVESILQRKEAQRELQASADVAKFTRGIYAHCPECGGLHCVCASL